MNDLVPWLQDAVAAAFVVLGLVTAISWLRSRDRSMGFLALAIILLSAVSGLGRLQAHLPFTIPLLGTLNLLGFAGSGYALLLYRDSLIPLPRRWHAVAIASLAAASVFLIVAQALSVGRTTSTIIAVVWVLIWCACVGEPIARSSGRPASWEAPRRSSSTLPARQPRAAGSILRRSSNWDACCRACTAESAESACRASTAA